MPMFVIAIVVSGGATSDGPVLPNVYSSPTVPPQTVIIAMIVTAIVQPIVSTKAVSSVLCSDQLGWAVFVSHYN